MMTTQSAGFDNDHQNHLDMMDFNGDQHNNKRKWPAPKRTAHHPIRSFTRIPSTELYRALFLTLAKQVNDDEFDNNDDMEK